MVLVRKTELACRNDWDQDLWESPDGSGPRSGVPTGAPVQLPVRNSDAQLPYSLGLLSPVEAADRLQSGDLYTDKVTSISMPLRPHSTLVDRHASEERAAVGHSASRDMADTGEARSAVREARRRRQELRSIEQRRYQERLVREAGHLLDSRLALQPDERVVHETPESPSHPARQWDSHLSSLEGDDVDLDAPRSRADVGSTERDRPQPAHAQFNIMFSPAAERFGREGSAADPITASTRESMQPAPETESKRRGETEPLPIAELNSVLGIRPRRPGAVSERVETTDRDDRLAPAGFVMEPPIPPRSARWMPVGGPIPLSTSRTNSGLSESEIPTALDTDPVDDDTELRTVPRCCGTCRDFRRLGDTDRGWCTNPHAFPERRMVESDGLACRSSIGVWWLPHDELWLERADTTHHGRPTPLLDSIARELPVGKQEMAPRTP